MSTISQETGGVVVGYDGSARADAAVDWAAQEAVRRRTSLAVLLATDFAGAIPGPVGPSIWPPPEAAGSARRVVEQGVARARAEAPNLSVHSVVRLGSAAGSLVDASSTAALVVVGTRGHGEVVGDLVGSVAFAVAAHAHCPAVVVRGDTRPVGPERPVVVGVDGSPIGELALQEAVDLARDTNAPIHLVSAWLMPVQRTWEYEYWSILEPGHSPRHSARAAAENLVQHARRQVLERFPGARVTSDAVEGTAWRVVAAATEGAGLAVIGSRGFGGFRSLLLGSVSRGVVHSAHCPVLVVHGPADAGQPAESSRGQADRPQA